MKTWTIVIIIYPKNSRTKPRQVIFMNAEQWHTQESLGGGGGGVRRWTKFLSTRRQSCLTPPLKRQWRGGKIILAIPLISNCVDARDHPFKCCSRLVFHIWKPVNPNFVELLDMGSWSSWVFLHQRSQHWRGGGGGQSEGGKRSSGGRAWEGVSPLPL